MRHDDRIRRLRELMLDKKLDAVLIPSFDHSSPNLYYFTEYEDNGPNFHIITQDEERLITWDYLRAKKESQVKDCTSILDSKISDFLKRRGLKNKKIGIDGNIRYTFILQLKKILPELILEDIRDDLMNIRSIKEDQEIEHIRNACLASDRILREIKNGSPINNDLSLKHEINRKIVNAGKEWSFDTLVAGDENSSNIHYFPKNQHFKKIVLIDFGIKSSQYTSDVSRTFLLEKDSKAKKAMDTLINLHSRLDDILEPGINARDVAFFAKKILEKEGYEKTSYSNTHSLGHGVGLHEHEFPILSEKSTHVLEKNMVFTLEPAIYFPGEFGIRLEDTVLMKGIGIQRLSRFPFE